MGAGLSKVATIGFFDGVHLGHKHIIDDVLAVARESEMESMVITFSRHPRLVVGSSFVPELLNTTDEKISLIKKAGIDHCVVLDFDSEMAKMTAHDFMKTILRDKYGVGKLVIGYDNRFGHNRQEGFDDYQAYGKELGIEVIQCNELTEDGRHVSSSVIRKKIAAGDIEEANSLLGYEYRLSGIVTEGTHVGRSLGFPTANLNPAAIGKLIPACGVYATIVETSDGERHASMTNIGCRPTFGGETTTIETNIFDFSRNIYGETIAVEFIKRIRTEQRFDSGQQLEQQLKNDKEKVLETIKHRKI